MPLALNLQQNALSQTMVVFDWDDTLFPTKARQLMRSRASKKLSKSEFLELCALSKSVHRVLRAYISLYSARNICIVTSAQWGWIQHCLDRVSGIGRWSQIRKLIFDPAQRIDIVCPGPSFLPFRKAEDVDLYKHAAFLYLIQSRSCARRPRISMLVSFGDSVAEYVASKRCAESFAGMCVGRVKLKKHPSIRCMTRQCQRMLDLCETLSPKNFDIDMSS